VERRLRHPLRLPSPDPNSIFDQPGKDFSGRTPARFDRVDPDRALPIEGSALLISIEPLSFQSPIASAMVAEPSTEGSEVRNRVPAKEQTTNDQNSTEFRFLQVAFH